MGTFRSLLATSVAVVCLQASAFAADYSVSPPVIESASVVPEEIGSGWYLRGDIGYSHQTPAKMIWQGTSETGVKSRDAVTYGAGLGYKFNPWMRADLTLDYINKYTNSGRLNATTTDTVRSSSLTMMANAYADLGNYVGITPYIGAGIGVANVTLGGLGRHVTSVGDYEFTKTTRLSLAASAATGLTYDLGHGIQADLGYRFLWIDKAETGSEKTKALAGKVNLTDLKSHQVRLGLRYYLN